MLLGIDLGTGSVKALLLAIDGDILAEASHTYAVHAPKPGWAESDPLEWWSAVGSVVKAVLQHQREPVQAIGLSGQMHGVVLTDEKGQPLYPAILWADMRSRDVLAIYRALDPALQDQLANPITAGMAGPTLLWIKQHQPELYQTAHHVFQPKDWVRFQLTGVLAAEPSDASGTLLYDVQHARWAEPVLDALNLRSDWLPPLIPSTRIAGDLTAVAAAHLGLPAGIPVVAGAADTAAAALGSGLTEPGAVQLTIGTGAQIITIRNAAIVDAEKRTHLYRSALANQWYTLAAMQNAGIALEWVRKLLGMSWEEVYAEAFRVPAGSEGLIFLPYLTGERTPHLDANARGAWIGLSLHHQRSHLMRSALEGVAFALRQGLDAMSIPNLKELRLTGGGTVEPVWKQLLADVLQVSLHPLTVTSASARGAALLAGLGIGIYRDVNNLPNVEIDTNNITNANSMNQELETAWQQFQTLYPAIKTKISGSLEKPER